MSKTQSHHLANMARKELERQATRRDILFSDGQNALDKILESPSPATLIQSFPDQDLYYLMHKIGVHDFTPVLAMATSEQWEYILDVEVWDDDRLDTHMMTQAFSQLFKADPQRFLRWTIMEKPDFFEYYLFQNMTVVVREHDDPPPSDFEDYTTFDDKFYFRFPDKRAGSGEDQNDELLPAESPEDHAPHEDAPELIENILKTLAQMDLSVFHGLLLETSALLPTETEEEQFRLKNIRLAEKGFLPTHDAVGIYQPVSRSELKKRPQESEKDNNFDPELPMPPVFFTQFLETESLFGQTLAHMRSTGDTTNLDSELAALLNKIISADRIKIRTRESIEKTMEKAMAFLSLGLEVLLDGDTQVENAVELVNAYYIEDIFRTGSRAGITLKTQAKTWYEASFLKKNNLPLSFLGESYLGVIGGLMIQRPMFFANYAEKELYRHFKSLSDIRSTERLLSEIISIDEFLSGLDIDTETFTQGVLTYKSMILTVWARNRIGLGSQTEHSLEPIPQSEFKPFFTALFDGSSKISETQTKDIGLWAAEVLDVSETELPVSLQSTLYGLIREIEEEYGHVKPESLDIRFMPLFLLTQDD